MFSHGNGGGFSRRLIVLVGASVLAAVVVVSVSVLAGNAGAQSTSSSKPNGLELAKPTDDKVVGSLARSGIPTVKFQSEETVSRGEASSDSGKSAEGDKFAVTSVDAGSLSLDARRDLQTDTVTLDGHSERITTSQKDALLALCEGLESSLGPTGAELSPSEDLLVRSVCYYADAPVGYKLTDATEKKPPREEPLQAPIAGVDTEFSNTSYSPVMMDDASDAPTPEECDRVETLKDSGRLKDFRIFVACQQNGQDGISYLTCKLRTHNLYHDSEFHCYRGGRFQTGPCAYACRGRCGPGCGNSNRRGVYSRDCAEHDRCAGHDGTRSWGVWKSDRSCGDEWVEARDDFLHGRNNCSGTGGC